jgi:AAA15 family ATPase/GTPase
MIKSFNIVNFKGYQNTTFNDLARINLIGGVNNIGKTSLLEAIFNYYDRLNPELFLPQLAWRRMNYLSFKENLPHELWQNFFYEFNIEKPIQFLAVHNSSRRDKVSISISSEFSPPKNSIHDISGDIVSDPASSKNIYEALHVKTISKGKLVQDTYNYLGTHGRFIPFVKSLVGQKIKKATYSSIYLLNPENEAIRYGEIMQDNLESFVLENLKIVDERIKSIAPVPLSNQKTLLHADIGMKRKIPLNYLGEGILRFLSFINSALQVRKGGTLLIDEIENGIHYSLHNKLWEMLFSLSKQFNIQIFITTHSKEITESFIHSACSLNAQKSFRYFELFRHHKTNEPNVNSIDIDNLEYRLQHNKSFRGE